MRNTNEQAIACAALPEDDAHMRPQLTNFALCAVSAGISAWPERHAILINARAGARAHTLI